MMISIDHKYKQCGAESCPIDETQIMHQINVGIRVKLPNAIQNLENNEKFQQMCVEGLRLCAICLPPSYDVLGALCHCKPQLSLKNGINCLQGLLHVSLACT